ncbi:hypothetical protein [Microcystis sp. M061S2]|jgi:hypothetical protein|uniref:hypothetical protein n=1 Tax=Microcystis sp. M061S2 TaxID=2771171 RepID=UPI002586DF05|nr:hypothetical protein [Microcystis sp. M061S2]MCA2656637.1 hypothetical protein [Microcystis sp. M061S2]
MATATKVLITLSKVSPKITRVVDVTNVFSATGAQAYVQELSGWDNCVVQIVSPSAAINFNTTSDNGSVTGTLPPVPQVPANWVSVQGTNLTTGTAVTSLAATGIVRFSNIGEFLQII